MCLKTRTNQVVLGKIGGGGHKVTILSVDKDRDMIVYYNDGRNEMKSLVEGIVIEGVVAMYNIDEYISGYVETGILLGQDGDSLEVQNGDLRISGYLIPLSDIEIGLSI